MKKEKELERIPHAVIYSQGDYMTIDFTSEKTDAFKLLGFLKIYIKKLEDELYESMERREKG